MNCWKVVHIDNPLEVKELQLAFQRKKPTFFGAYKREITCMRIFYGLSHLPVSIEIDGIAYVKSIVYTNRCTYYPVIGHYDLAQQGRLIDVDVICQNHNYIVPFSLTIPYIHWDAKATCFKSLDYVKGIYQKSWPGYSKFPDHFNNRD